MSKQYLVSSIGNAIVDILIFIDDDFLLQNSLTKGSMTLIDKAMADKLSELAYHSISSGGSVCNSVATISSLGLQCSFTGKIGKDAFGNNFSKDLLSSNCDFNQQYSDLDNSTSKSFILVSKEDGERTMLTYLGKSSEIDDNYNDKIIQSSEMIYIEGYLWDKKETIDTINNLILTAKQQNVKTIFTLSDSFCVLRHKNNFLELIKNIDILFANADEIKILTDIKDIILEQDKLQKIFEINPNLKLVITNSDKGSIIVTKDQFTEISTKNIKNVTDSTGAGDIFAAGFLLGLANNIKLEECCKIGNLLASKIIQKVGARFNKNEIKQIKEELCQQFGI